MIEVHGADALASLMNCNRDEVASEIDRRLKRDGFVQNASGVWCEFTLDGESLRVGGLR